MFLLCFTEQKFVLELLARWREIKGLTSLSLSLISSTTKVQWPCLLLFCVGEPTHSTSSQDIWITSPWPCPCHVHQRHNSAKNSIINKRKVLFNTSCSILPVSCPVDVSGVSTSKTSTIEVTAELEKEVMTLDDEETFGNFYKSVSPSTLHDSSVVLTEEDLSQIQADTPKLVYSNHRNDE